MLTIKNLSKQYNGKVIFKDLNVTVADGQILTVVGPSGIGKTTFLRVLAGLTKADAGEISLNQHPLLLNENRTGAEVGVIFQDFNLFPQYTVFENITLAPRIVARQHRRVYQPQAEELLAQLHLTEQRDFYPFQLSGGQKQRTAIARALAMQPGVLAYDEPTSGLDETTTQQVVTVIKQLQQQGVTQIVVTHDRPFADQLSGAVLDFGTDVVR
ncbi:amino acid ABC transporter ATP-binding protein [Fructilactobacillus florum]|uniref:Arginine transport ATP-binding protein artM n=1 Tax=Fructilactobacillus florum DSM 22689 = JCM 16035 TaxID=1423745 RepID=A0A0R2CKY8_9LACO|nr:ATP-binding cassette domain-containing protein [Fructilactobacillus florum]KRM92241.1 arginine transport ATP-binding protein artM [Fructilactobacillus florum DSM 22689 = JCM 16035]